MNVSPSGREIRLDRLQNLPARMTLVFTLAGSSSQHCSRQQGGENSLKRHLLPLPRAIKPGSTYFCKGVSYRQAQAQGTAQADAAENVQLPHHVRLQACIRREAAKP
jgi:hypothetical protein